MFKDVTSQVNFPELEANVRSFWEQKSVPKRVLELRKDGPLWVVYEGPPTANNKPALHHVWTSLYKDVYPRFQIMRGKFVPRRGGWDCQGLPVEIQIEKELGFTRKEQIEEYGIAAFNERCRSIVQRYVKDFEEVFRLIAYWVDLDDAYRTMDSTYIESVWWHLKQLWASKLLYEGQKVVPYCPRCETALSSHELGQPEVYRDVEGPSVFVRFPLFNTDLTLIVWTTTPWTLLSNVAVAVNRNIEYGVYEYQGEKVIVSTSAAQRFQFGEPLNIISGSELIGKHYVRPFDIIQLGENECRVVDGKFVTVDQGSGLVHIAPAFGEDDNILGEQENLPAPNPVDARGCFTKQVGIWQGKAVRDADPEIIEDLRNRGLLFHAETLVHSYPHCWRCRTPLLYWAKPSWFIRTSELKNKLMDENDKVEWYPSTIKYGRFGNWLENNIDWALSRDRYWGTPVPIWRCANNHDTCISSREELGQLANQDLSTLDLHRPYVDDVIIRCPSCGESAKRVGAVCDVWLDSGCMPAAQIGYPNQRVDEFSRNYPADFICESLDQTRGWFYSLLAVNTLVHGKGPYKNVVCLGLLVDQDGRKMSKSLGNVVNPMDLLPRFGADAVRWYLINSGSPWVPKRISFDAIEQGIRKVLLTLWNTYSFFVTYANLEHFVPSQDSERTSHVLDRWLQSRIASLIQNVTRSLDGYDALTASQELSDFVDDLSNWYVRRSRERFWGTGNASDPAAFQTLYDALVIVTKLIAPICPYIAEEIYRNLVCSVDQNAPDSVHLCDWPEAILSDVDQSLEKSMGQLRRIVTLARSARADAGMKLRQPLRRMLAQGLDSIPDDLMSLALDELNIKELERTNSLDHLVKYEIQPNFRLLGERLGAQLPLVQSYLRDADARLLKTTLASSGHVEIVVGENEKLTLSEEELKIRSITVPGWATAEYGEIRIAIDLSLDDDLRAEGLARDLVRVIQETRKQSGFNIADRIELWVSAPIGLYISTVAKEVLATTFHEGLPPTDSKDIISGKGFALRKIQN